METEIQEKSTGGWLLILGIFAILLSIRLVITVISDASYFPINVLKIEAPYQNISRVEIQNVFTPFISYSFLMFPEKKVVKELKKNQWIEDVKIKKIWPDQIVVQIFEQIPVAIWNNMYVNSKGVLFNPQTDKKIDTLPIMIGPEYHQKDVLHIYKKLSKLLKAQDLTILKIKLRDNLSWDITLQNGVLIRLGKRNIEKRVMRFCEVYPKLFATTFDQVNTIDLRYAKGMAVNWKKTNDQINSNPKNVMG
jgi:cell division protein FtsQ